MFITDENGNMVAETGAHIFNLDEVKKGSALVNNQDIEKLVLKFFSFKVEGKPNGLCFANIDLENKCLSFSALEEGKLYKEVCIKEVLNKP